MTIGELRDRLDKLTPEVRKKVVHHLAVDRLMKKQGVKNPYSREPEKKEQESNRE